MGGGGEPGIRISQNKNLEVVHDAHGNEEAKRVGKHHNPTIVTRLGPLGIFGLRGAHVMVKAVEEGNKNAGDHNVTEAYKMEKIR